MKPIAYLYTLIGICAASCGTPPTFNNCVTILIDRTDAVRATYPTAQSIATAIGLPSLPTMGVQIRLSYISDKDINTAVVLTLDSESYLTGNPIMRAAKVRQFLATVQRSLDSMKAVGTCRQSVIFRTVAAEANYLARLPVQRKWLLVLSDLREHSNVNFYDPATLRLLQVHPDSIAVQFERTTPLGTLSGMHIFFLYDPRSYADNNSFMAIARLYERMLTAHGATVHIANSFVPQ